MGRMTRLAGTTVLTGALLVGSAGVAFAHECMIVNRSTQGQQAVGNSPMWFSEDMATAGAYEFTFVAVYELAPDDPRLDDLVAEAVAIHISERGIDDWTAFFLQHTLLTSLQDVEGDHTHNPAADRHSGDGQGVDHWSDSELGQTMIRIAGEVLAASG